jgi:hypothetical protein
MKLTFSDKQSSTWIKLAKHIDEEVAILREKNDNDLDPIATARIRGRILALKKILSLAAEELPTPVEQ